MKFLFVVPGDGHEYDSWLYPSWKFNRLAPIGPLWIMSYLHAKGHDVKMLDCRAYFYRFRTGDLDAIVRAVVNYYQPDAIGVGFPTGVFNEAASVVQTLKTSFPTIPIVAGGPHPSIEPHDTFRRMELLDAVCIGPGEEVCLDIAEGKEWSEIAGLMLRDDPEGYRQRPVEMNIDKYPFPDYALADVGYYTAPNLDSTLGFLCRSLYTIGTRSCPNSCKFCASDWSKPVRRHSPEYVVEMARFLARFDIQWIAFYDDSMIMDRKWIESVCEGFIRSGIFHPRGRLRWRAMARADQIEPQILKLMKEAGCGSIGIGMESGRDRILNLLEKGSTTTLSEQAVRYVEEAGIVPSGNFIIGFPTETEEDIDETIAFMKRIDLNRMGLTTFRPLPGSPFYYELLEKGVIDRDTVDWARLGHYGTAPDSSFCEVDAPRLRELFEKAYAIAHATQYYTVYENHAGELPSDLVDEVRNANRQKDVKVLVESDEDGKYTLKAVPYKKWRRSRRYRLGRIGGRRASGAQRAGPGGPGAEETEAIRDHLRESFRTADVNGPFVHLLFDLSGRDLRRSLYKIHYGKRIWPPLITCFRGRTVFRPTTRMDHLATPFIAVSPDCNAGERLRISCRFTDAVDPCSELVVSVQNEQYEGIGSMTFNQVEPVEKCVMFSHVIELPIGVERFRLVLMSIDGTPTPIPEAVKIEQSEGSRSQ